MTPEQNESQREFEEWYSWCSFNSGDTKYACREAWQAACASTEKRLLASRVHLPEMAKRKEQETPYGQAWAIGFNDCLDQIKLVPLSVEKSGDSE